MTQQEHLLLIRAKCVELLELAKQRTPGRWEWEGLKRRNYEDDNGNVIDYAYVPECSYLTGGAFMCANDNAENRGNDALFIASAAGPFEAALASTVAAIDKLDDMPCTVADILEDSILESWPLELLQP